MQPGKTIELEERGIELSNEEEFIGFTVQANAEYQQEAIKEYGEEMVLESNGTPIIDAINRLFMEFAQYFVTLCKRLVINPGM